MPYRGINKPPPVGGNCHSEGRRLRLIHELLTWKYLRSVVTLMHSFSRRAFSMRFVTGGIAFETVGRCKESASAREGEEDEEQPLPEIFKGSGAGRLRGRRWWSRRWHSVLCVCAPLTTPKFESTANFAWSSSNRQKRRCLTYRHGIGTLSTKSDLLSMVRAAVYHSPPMKITRDCTLPAPLCECKGTCFP